MYLLRLFCFIIFSLMLHSCGDKSTSSFSNEDINSILAQVDEDDLSFTQKEVQFDSIVTLAGTRTINGSPQKIKIKLFYFGEFARGYFNVKEIDDKNLQMFGKSIDNLWAFKCVTKLNMEEAGGYIIIDNNQGIWSNGHINFKKEQISLEKQDIDYTNLINW